MDFNHKLETNITVINNDFIDRYMTSANGEYVKVYLYLLRHGRNIKNVASIADALNYTESDISRALSYWEKQGVIQKEKAQSQRTEAPAEKSKAECAPEQMEALLADENFSQLLYIAQKYMNKIFTSRDCRVFAYLYNELHINAELLEYIVEFCVQGGHGNLRYIETVALDWHQRGIQTAEQAKNTVVHYTNDMFAVMKAFGIQDRKPGSSEAEMMNKWYRVYGFSKEIVLEACKRTLEAIQKPSFPYTDAILSDWHKAGVKRLDDINRSDGKKEQMQEANSRSRQVPGQKNKNQFHNFEQRNTNYDALVLERLKERLEES